MVRSALLATAAASLSLTASEASAHSAHQRHAYQHHRIEHYASHRRRPGHYDYGSNVAAARARGLPWCGAEMADEIGIHGQAGRELWLARNWAQVGAPTSAHVGAVVVWPHHVGRIVGQDNGQWVVRSGNDGGGVDHGYGRWRGPSPSAMSAAASAAASQLQASSSRTIASATATTIRASHVSRIGRHCGCTRKPCNRTASVPLSTHKPHHHWLRALIQANPRPRAGGRDRYPQRSVQRSPSSVS